MLKKWLVLLLITINIPLMVLAKADVDSLYQIARNSGDLQQAIEVYDLASELGNKKVAANAQYLIGWMYRQKKEYKEAVRHYFEASLIYEKLHEEVLLANVYEDIGEIFIKTLHYNNALLFYGKTLTLRKNQDNSEKYGQTLFNIGIANRKLGVYDSALHYYTLARDSYLSAGVSEPLKAVYNDMGLIMELTGSHELAEEYYHLVLSQAKDEVDEFWESKSLHNVGTIAVKMGNMDEGLSFYHQALAIREKLNSERFIMSTLNNIGWAYQTSGELATAKEYFQKAVEHTEHEDNELKMDTYRQLSRLEEKTGNPEVALEYGREYEAITEKILTVKNETEQVRLFYEGELALQQIKQIQLAKIEFEKYMLRTIVWSIVLILSVGLLFLSVGLLLFFYKKARRYKKGLSSIVKELTLVIQEFPRL